MTEPGRTAWQRSLLAAAVLAAGRQRIGGLRLRARAGPVRDAWLERFKAQLPPATVWRRITPNVPLPRLIGGLDIARTLEAGRPRLERGVLGAADGGVLVVSMAERAPPDWAATIGLAMDNGGIRVERSGLSLFQPSCFTLLCLDESAEDDEALPDGLADRLALDVDLSPVGWSETNLPSECGGLASTETDLPRDVEVALETALLACGRHSLRTSVWIRRVSKLVASLAGARVVDADHAATALQLVCPQALSTLVPETVEDRQTPEPGEYDIPDDQTADQTEDPGPVNTETPPLADILVAARTGLLPELALDIDRLSPARSSANRRSGKSGMLVKSGRRGRPVGLSNTPPWPGARPDVPATLRAAAPWQVVRKRQRDRLGLPSPAPIDVRKSDFRYRRLRERTETTAILTVDASGSTALERLGEAKGAAELLLANCYVRREQVALIAFRGDRSEILLPPTRSLVRAKKCLASLVGGGGTPLASGLSQAMQLGLAAMRHGQKPLIVLLTDGSANIALDGTPGRQAARRDAEAVAQQLPAFRIPSVVIDISHRIRDATRELADTMDADYHALPRADARSVSAVVSNHLS